MAELISCLTAWPDPCLSEFAAAKASKPTMPSSGDVHFTATSEETLPVAADGADHLQSISPGGAETKADDFNDATTAAAVDGLCRWCKEGEHPGRTIFSGPYCCMRCEYLYRASHRAATITSCGPSKTDRLRSELVGGAGTSNDYLTAEMQGDLTIRSQGLDKADRPPVSPTDAGTADAQHDILPRSPPRRRWGQPSHTRLEGGIIASIPLRPPTAGTCRQGSSSDNVAMSGRQFAGRPAEIPSSPAMPPVATQTQVRIEETPGEDHSSPWFDVFSDDDKVTPRKDLHPAATLHPPPPRRFAPRSMLFSAAELLHFPTALHQGLHKEARACLQTAIFDLTQDLSIASIDLNSRTKWPRWKAYVANHRCKAQLVATGIVSVTAERVAAKDPNRGGDNRIDIIFHHATGGCCRIHPGSKVSNDAQPKNIYVYAPYPVCVRLPNADSG